MSKRLVRGLVAAAVFAFTGSALAQTVSSAAAGYPDRPVKIIVPFAAGGPSDVIARLLAQKLSEHLGKQFYVDNQPGGGSNIGINAAARAAPDGHTILLVSSSYIINPGLYAKLPYDPNKDFVPITIAVDSPHVFITHPSLQVKSMKNLVDLIKANPGKYSYASPGVGSAPHLAVELLKRTYDLDIIHVPFRGGGPAAQSVLGGHTPIGCVALPPTVPLIKAGQLDGLAVTSAKRFPTVPDVPTMTQAGYPDQESVTIQGMFVPAKTPKAIVDLLYGEIVKILKAPGMEDRLAELGYAAVLNTPEEFAKMIAVEVPKWTKVIKDAKIEVQ